MTRRAVPLLLVAVVSVLALAACGGGGGGSTSASTTPPAGGGTTGGGGGGGGSTVKISADPSGALKYEETDVTAASSGPVTIDFTNMSSVPHNVTIEGNGASGGTSTITGSSTSTTIDLQPGTYTFFCSVDSHRQAGMEGKLVVK
jgi:plastocyanin